MPAPRHLAATTVNVRQSPDGRSRLDALPYAAYLVLAAVLAAALTLFFFCPRFSEWQALYLPAGANFPETSRAIDTLRQLQDPWTPIESRSNRVIQWRLLFPVVGHFLRLPPALFLALPHIGCLAALALLVHVACRELGSRLAAFFTAVLSAGCAWFFVSTGWLSYNDSWIVLGLVTVAFIRSRYALFAAALLCPWIDERFLLTLPVCLYLRTCVGAEAHSAQSTLRDLGVAILGTGPYVLVRLFAYFGGSDPVTAGYVGETSRELPSVWHVLDGAWAGLRCHWFYAFAFCWLVCRRQGRWNALFVAGIGLVFAASVLIAHDIGRTASSFLPVALAGVILLHRQAPKLCARTLPWLMVVNLLLPAWHVIGGYRGPISYYYTELGRWRQTPDFLTPDHYVREGIAAMTAGQVDAARYYFETALRLDPGHREATLLLRRLGD